MIESPCTDKCPTYAMCKQRENFQRFAVCSQYADYIVEKIRETQSSFDKEFGKGKKTVVGWAEPGSRFIINEKGQKITTVESARKMNEKGGGAST